MDAFAVLRDFVAEHRTAVIGWLMVIEGLLVAGLLVAAYAIPPAKRPRWLHAVIEAEKALLRLAGIIKRELAAVRVRF